MATRVPGRTALISEDAELNAGSQRRRQLRRNCIRTKTQSAEARPETSEAVSRMYIVIACGRLIVDGADVDGEAFASVIAVLGWR